MCLFNGLVEFFKKNIRFIKGHVSEINELNKSLSPYAILGFVYKFPAWLILRKVNTIIISRNKIFSAERKFPFDFFHVLNSQTHKKCQLTLYGLE